MNKLFYIRLLFRGAKDLVIRVTEPEQEALRDFLTGPTFGGTVKGFYGIETVDGRSYIVNVKYIQAARYLWEPPMPTEVESSKYEGGVRIRLRGKKRLQDFTESVQDLADIFSFLQLRDDDKGAYVGFDDEDGEYFQINPRELVWMLVPSAWLNEGRVRNMREDQG